MAIVIAWAKAGGHWLSRVSAPMVMVVSAAAGGGFLGFVVSAIGSGLPSGAHLAAVGTFGICTVAGLILCPLPWQRDRETPRRWLLFRDWRTSCTNGIALGMGFTTRLGTWGFYSLPIFALNYGKVSFGTAFLAAYGAIRVTLSWLFTLPRMRATLEHHVRLWAGASGPVDRFLSGMYISVAVSAGLATA